MLPKTKRIPRKMFPLLLNGAKTFKNSLFLVRAVQSPGGSRFGFSVSKKVAKSAVVRNRMRRQGYGNLSKYIDRINGGLLIQFAFRMIPKDAEEVDKNLIDVLQKNNLFK